MSVYRNILMYETDSGRHPVAEYIESVNRPSDRAKIMKILEAVEQLKVLPNHFFKKLSGRGELWEVRALQHRLLGFHTKERGTGPLEFVLVSAFSKQSNKTPAQEIEVALRRRDAYLSRRGDPQ